MYDWKNKTKTCRKKSIILWERKILISALSFANFYAIHGLLVFSKWEFVSAGNIGLAYADFRLCYMTPDSLDHGKSVWTNNKRAKLHFFSLLPSLYISTIVSKIHVAHNSYHAFTHILKCSFQFRHLLAFQLSFNLVFISPDPWMYVVNEGEVILPHLQCSHSFFFICFAIISLSAL